MRKPSVSRLALLFSLALACGAQVTSIPGPAVICGVPSACAAGSGTPLVIPQASNLNLSYAPMLPNTFLGFANELDNVSDAHLLCFGDSTCQGYGSGAGGNFPTFGSWFNSTRLKFLRSASYNGLTTEGRGTDSRFTFNSGWGIGSVGFGGASMANLVNTNTMVFTPGSTQGTYDTFDVWYLCSSGFGAFNMTATGNATPVAINEATCTGIGSTGANHSTVTAGSSGTGNALTITPTNSTGVYIFSIRPFLSTAAHSVSIDNVSVFGSQTSDWIATGQWTTAALLTAYCATNCGVLVDLGINDAAAGVTVATYTANIQTIITNIKAAGADAILIAPPPQQSGTVNSLLSQYVTALYSLAASNKVPLIDIFYGFGSNFNSPFMFNGNHPNDQGYWQWASIVSDWFIQAGLM